MKLQRLLWSLAIAFLVLQLLLPSQESAMEFVPVAVPTDCICFEYYYNDKSLVESMIFQSCEMQILDQLTDSNLKVSTFTLPCEEIFAGTRAVDQSAIKPSFVQVD